MDGLALAIQSASALVADKRMRFQQLGMMNVYGVDEATRMRISMDYTQAQAELANAETALQRLLLQQQSKPHRNG